MSHPLDRPVWSALTTRQKALALGDARALRMAPDFGVFAAAANDSPESLSALAALIPAGGAVALAEAEEPGLPPGMQLLGGDTLNQMIAARMEGIAPAFEILALGDADAPEMLALATMTEPGPFFSRTHQLGDFLGVRQGRQLVAMAGERLKPDGFTEVSGVCTHPDHRGQGHAGTLMRLVAAKILARGETPFLHVRASNSGAIALYETLGFRFRRAIHLRILGRAGS